MLWSQKDTDETIRQAKIHNCKFDTLCEPDPKKRACPEAARAANQ